MPGGNPPDIAVRVSNQLLPQRVLADIREVTVEEALDAFGMFTIVLCNWDDQKQRVSWSDSDQFFVGKPVEISLGYVGNLHSVINGEITGLEPTFEVGQVPMLTVRGYDLGHRMGRRLSTRTYTDTNEGDLARTFAREYKLQPDVEAPGTGKRELQRVNKTVWEFLRERADQIGFEFFVRLGKLYFRSPQHTGNASATLTLGDDILSFAPRLNVRGQMDQVWVKEMDGKANPVTGEAKFSDLNTMGGTTTGAEEARRLYRTTTQVIEGKPVAAMADTDALAKRHLDNLALKYVQGRVVCRGLPKLHPGIVVKIEEAGTRFSGNYYVTEVTHASSREKGYQTTLSVRRTAT